VKLDRYIFIFCILLTANSCWAEKQAEFAISGSGVTARDDEIYPLYTSSNNISGIFDLSKTKHYDYSLSESARVPRNYSLEIDYIIQEEADAEPAPAGENYETALKIDDDSGWLLPDNLNFIKIDRPNARIRYDIPLQTTRIKKISFEIKGVKKSGAKLRLNSLRFTERFYGFNTEDEIALVSPFVNKTVNQEYAAAENGDETYVITINPGEYYAISGPQVLFMDGITGAPVISAGANVIQYIANTGQNKYHYLTVPAVFLAKNTIQINGSVEKALLKPSPQADALDMTPVTADPGFILKYPPDEWRNKDFEIFFWESFPNILIFDTASYAAQDKFFKRIAFFAEKKGFKGRLARDEEIAELHGWNAHDYNAETLANFFNGAKKTSFPLLEEEILLREILLKNNIIKSDGDNFVPGNGAVISISRESPEYLRLTFMTHEAFHGIFFIDADFREFCKQRWDNLNRTAKHFITSYFDFQQYDIKDSYLVLNEFMAHCLQQGVSASGKYFGETLAVRLSERSPWRMAALPPRDENTGNWPIIAETFRAEAAAFSEYAAAHWGLAAGRVWRVRL
jgi:hypothetical protein